MAECETNSNQLSTLCDVLLEGFHAAAQPLTMLQAGLSTDCTGMLPEPELRELTETCAREADRLTRTFRLLKRLVQSYRYPPVLGRVNLADMVKSRTAEIAWNGDGRPIPVRVQVNPELPPVLADRDATGDMLQTLVEALSAYCDADDMILISAAAGQETVQLTIACGSSSLNRVPGEFKVAMPLASGRMEQQGGSASWRTSPMAVELTFATIMSAE